MNTEKSAFDGKAKGKKNRSHHDAVFSRLAESLLMEDAAEQEATDSPSGLLAAHSETFPVGSPEHDAVEAALARGYVPGTYQFDQFFAWSMNLLLSVSH